MSRPRLLVPISLQFSIRYLLRTGLLSSLADSFQPIVLLAWQDPDLINELVAAGCEVYPLPHAEWGADYERARGLMNVIFKARMRSPSGAIRERRADLDRTLAQRLRLRAKNSLSKLKAAVPGGIRRAQREEETLFERDTNFASASTFVNTLRIDAAFSITPFLYDEEMTLRACRRHGMPTITSILSYDNLTTRSWIPVNFDRYLVWNRHNANQLLRGYPECSEGHIQVVGSPQFDFYYDPQYLWEELEWRRELGIPQDTRILLFGGGYYTCAPHEPQFLAHLNDAIERGDLPEDVYILFRKHPVDPIGRWQPILQSAHHVIYDEPWQTRERVLGHTNITRRDIEKLFSTLYHSCVHVNVASTMSVDGAIVDRPQIGPAYDESPTRKYHRAAYECYLQEHNLPILESGGVNVARSREELVSAVKQALASPSDRAEGRRKMVSEICTFNDGTCTHRVLDAVREFLNGAVQRPTAVRHIPV